MSVIPVPQGLRDRLDQAVGGWAWCGICRATSRITGWSGKRSIHGHVKFYEFGLACRHGERVEFGGRVVTWYAYVRYGDLWAYWRTLELPRGHGPWV